MSNSATMSGSQGTPTGSRFESAADKAKDAAANAADKAKEVAANVGDKASQAASTLGDKASQAAAAIGGMASDAGCAVGSMTSQAACDVGRKADDLTSSAGASIKELGDKLSHSAPHTGMMGSATQAVARTVHDGGQYLEDAKLSGMAEDVAQLIRRNPIPAVFVALGLGWIVASRTRN